jgi:hypothetical protein
MSDIDPAFFHTLLQDIATWFMGVRRRSHPSRISPVCVDNLLVSLSLALILDLALWCNAVIALSGETREVRL